jgi:3-deoxy-D-manno-octulosonic-acid transferase
MTALFVYNLLLLLLFPLLYGFLLWRRTRGKEDREHWGERWGKLPENIGQDRGVGPRFWVHAVSVGEVMAAAPVLRELRRRFPDALIVVSTTTIGGREVAQKQVPPADEVVYYPLDFPWAVHGALCQVRPDAVLLMEWEIWPNFLTEAKKRGAKIAVLNGRISDRGLRRGTGGLAGFFTAPGLAAVDRFAMQSEEDARRAVLVGADQSRVEWIGNTKFDETSTPLSIDERAALRADLGIPANSPVWICGSTRDGEEVLIAAAVRRVWETVPDLFLIVAPRHLTRADEAADALKMFGQNIRRRSTPLPPVPLPSEGEGVLITETTAASHSASGITEIWGGADAAIAASTPSPSEGRGVLLLDTFGELGRVYAVADVAFVGGSLLPFGGQSVFQPLAQGVPALFGPYMNNQRDIAGLSKAEGIGFEVADTEQLAVEVVRLVSLTEEEKVLLAQKARGLIERNQGVSARCVDVIVDLLGQRA